MSGFASRSRSFCLCVAGVASIIALSGCAADKPPTLAERVAAAGESHAELAKLIAEATDLKNEAEDDVRAAKKAIKKAQKDLDQANEDLEKANERVVETRRALADAEAEAHRRGFVPAPPPES
ncbi:MAG: hypothetical protein IPK00_22470 [Deltaproteobacteria bacterium]|nr:hypothetical protein [Deltaproteobacteria bacterium]